MKWVQKNLSNWNKLHIFNKDKNRNRILIESEMAIQIIYNIFSKIFII